MLFHARFIFFLGIIVFKSHQVDGYPHIGIGIVCDHTTCKTEEPSYTLQYYNVTIDWRMINTREMYQVMKTIQLLDKSENVSLIMLVEYDSSLLRFPRILKTSKPLLDWGSNYLHDKRIQPIRTDENGSENRSVCPIRGQVHATSLVNWYCNLYMGNETRIRHTMNYGEIVLNLIKYLKWREVVVLFNNKTRIVCDHTTCKTEEPSYTLQYYNVTIDWRMINTREMYQVMKTIQLLDKSENVSLIMLVEYDSSLLRFPRILKTSKPLLDWGSNYLHDKRIQPIRTDENGSENRSVCPIRGQVHATSLVNWYCNLYMGNETRIRHTMNYGEIVLNLIKYLKWREVVVLFNNKTQFQTAHLIDKLSEAGVLAMVYNIDTTNDLHYVLNKIYRQKVKLEQSPQFLTLCSFDCTKNILNTANTFDEKNPYGQTLLSKFSLWLSVVLDGNRGMRRQLSTSACSLDNVATVIIPGSISASSQEVVHNIETTLCELYHQSNSSNQSHDKTLKESFISTLTRRSFELDTSYVCRSFYVDTLLWGNHNRMFSTVGTVSEDGISVTSDIFPNTKYGYNKKQFIVSTLAYAPFVMKEVVNGTTEYSGLSIDLLLELAANLNFTFKIIEPSDQKWGSYISKENKTFNGLIGQLQRKECDLVFTVISAQKERTVACDFSYPYFYQFTTVVLKRPDPRDNKWRTLIDPFHWLVHIAIGVALLMTTLVIYLLEKYNPIYRHCEEKTGIVETDRLNHLHNAFWYMFGALLAQGGVHLPNSFAGRTFVSCWWLFSLVIVGTYCGNLIAFLTVTKETMPFNTLREMTKMSDEFKWGTLGGSFWEVVFTTSTTPVFRDIGDKMVEFNRSDSDIFHLDPKFHVQRVKEGGYAWIADKTYIERVVATDCDLVRIKEEVFPWLITVGLIKDSPHTRIFDAAIMKIHESGLLDLWKKKWWPKSNICKKKNIPEAKPISLTDVQSAFYVCCAGISISLIAFGCEHIVSCVRKRFCGPLSSSKDVVTLRTLKYTEEPVKINEERL